MKKTAVFLFTIFIYVTNVAGQDIKEDEGETKLALKKKIFLQAAQLLWDSVPDKLLLAWALISVTASINL